MSKEKKDTQKQNGTEELHETENVQKESVKEKDGADGSHPKGKKEDEEIQELRQKLTELNDKYLRLSAEFDNYRKRTLREKADLIKNGGEAALKNLLPVVDDFERALQNIRNSDDVEAVKEGVELIYSKFMAYLAQQGVKAIEAVGQPFDTEMFEAVATIPAPEPGMKGKILDCVQTGYTLNDRVLRHAKVVVGE